MKVLFSIPAPDRVFLFESPNLNGLGGWQN